MLYKILISIISVRVTTACFLSVSVIHSSQAATNMPEDLTRAISQAAAYRSRAESVAETIKVKYQPGNNEYDRARLLYIKASHNNNLFANALTRILDESVTSEACANAASIAGVTANDYVRQVSPEADASGNRSLLALLPPFMALLAAILQYRRQIKASKSAVVDAVRREISWKAWDEI